jgi:methyl-accepting chemotaxis protein
MTLKTLFVIPVTIILLVTLSLGGMMAGEGWLGLRIGRQGVDAVENMRLLLLVQSDLRSERVASNYILGLPPPPSGAAREQLSRARTVTDERIAAVIRRLRGDANEARPVPEPYLVSLLVRLGIARAAIDRLVDLGLNQRGFSALSAVQPMMLWVAQVLEQPIARTGLEIIAADPGLSGLLTEERLATSLRDHIGLIAAVTIPRINNRETPTASDKERTRILGAEASYLLRLLRNTIEFSGATDTMRAALAQLERFDRDGLVRYLTERSEIAPADLGEATEYSYSLPQRILIPWGEQVNALRLAIVDELVSRVSNRARARERSFDIALTACGLVWFAMLECIFVLRRRVVGPLANLGSAITRIAAGDRSVPLVMHSETREIAEMEMAVETLRQAALVADAAAMREHHAELQRLELLRQAIEITRTVREPARALEQDVERLAEGIDATIALADSSQAPGLRAAAEAIRTGLDELRHCSADLDATFSAASGSEEGASPEAVFVAHVLAVKNHVDRGEETVRGFVQMGLAALRDASSATEAPRDPQFRDLVSDQFQRLEHTVATMASMQAAARKAAAIVREMPLLDAPLAA